MKGIPVVRVGPSFSKILVAEFSQTVHDDQREEPQSQVAFLPFQLIPLVFAGSGGAAKRYPQYK